MDLIELRNKTKIHCRKTNIDVLDMLIYMLEYDSEIDYIFSDFEEKNELISLVKVFREGGNTIPQSFLTKEISKKNGSQYTDIEFLEFILKEKNEFSIFLEQRGFCVENILDNMHVKKSNMPSYQPLSYKIDKLELLCDNMTKEAMKGRYDVLFGREDEIMSMENILLRKEKSSLILTGSSGVGKTALVKLQVKHALKGRLNNYTFYNLDITNIISDSAYRGQVEKKLLAILSLAQKKKDAIIFIDEIHRINFSDNASSLTIAEILKPYLSENKVKIIGATTIKEYQKHFSQSPPLMRRFQQVAIKELVGNELFDVVKSNAMSLERHHGVQIGDDAIRLTIDLTNEHIKEKNQPDKSNDVLDSACIFAYRSNEEIVRKEHIIKSISVASNIPDFIIEKKPKSFQRVADKIKSQIFGQDKQIDLVTKTLMVKLAGFRNENSPLATMMFAGNSGVGKTCLTHVLADEMLPDKNAYTLIDMSEFSEAHSVSKLIGSPPGYVGSDKIGILCEALSGSSYQIIVLDEIEKAASQVHKLFLGILDTGTVRGGTGITYDASNAIFIFTTNALTSTILGKQSIGFGNDANSHSNVMDALKTTFPTEFLGRIDEVVLFNELNNDDYKSIIKHNLEKLRNQFLERKVHINYNEDIIVNNILEKYRYKELGVRGMMDIIRNRIIIPLTYQMIEKDDEGIQINLEDIWDHSIL